MINIGDRVINNEGFIAETKISSKAGCLVIALNNGGNYALVCRKQEQEQEQEQEQGQDDFYWVLSAGAFFASDYTITNISRFYGKRVYWYNTIDLKKIDFLCEINFPDGTKIKETFFPKLGEMLPFEKYAMFKIVELSFDNKEAWVENIL